MRRCARSWSASRVTAAGRRLVVDLMTRKSPTADAILRALTPMLTRFEHQPYLRSRSTQHQATTTLTGTNGVVVTSLPPPSIEDAPRGHRRGGRRRTPARTIPTSSKRSPTASRSRFPDVPDAVAIRTVRGVRERSPDAGRGRGFARPLRAHGVVAAAAAPRRLEPDPCPDDRPVSCLDRVILPQQPKPSWLADPACPLQPQGARRLGLGTLVDARASPPCSPARAAPARPWPPMPSRPSSDRPLLRRPRHRWSANTSARPRRTSTSSSTTPSAGAVLSSTRPTPCSARSAVSDAHDRYANIEVAYLLQRMEQFAGLAILTTNYAQTSIPLSPEGCASTSSSPAQARRSAADWEQSIPPPIPAPGARSQAARLALDVTGGIIRQMALHAAVSAAEPGRRSPRPPARGARAELIRLGSYGDLPKLDALSREPSRRGPPDGDRRRDSRARGACSKPRSAARPGCPRATWTWPAPRTAVPRTPTSCCSRISFTPTPELRNAERVRAFPGQQDPPRLLEPAVPLDLHYLLTTGTTAARRRKA